MLKLPANSGSSVSGETSWSGSSSPNNWLESEKIGRNWWQVARKT